MERIYIVTIGNFLGKPTEFRTFSKEYSVKHFLLNFAISNDTKRYIKSVFSVTSYGHVTHYDVVYKDFKLFLQEKREEAKVDA